MNPDPEREDKIGTAAAAAKEAEERQRLAAEERDEAAAKLAAAEGRLESVEAERARMAEAVAEKESLVQSLSQEVESLRAQQQQQQPQQPQQQQEQGAPLHPEVGAAFGVDVAESNRPPPDVTQGQSSQQPDVAGPAASAHFGGQGAPDLMPNAADFFNQPGPAIEAGQDAAAEAENQAAGFADYFGRQASGEEQFFAAQQPEQPGYFDAFAQAQADPQPMAEEPIQQQQQQQQPQQEPAVIQERGGDAETLRQMVAQLESERDELAAKCSTIESRLQG